MGSPSAGRKGDDPHYAELVGVAAAAASLYAAHAKTIIPLRVAATVANLLAIAYSHMHGTYPTFVLNALLLPLNALAAAPDAENSSVTSARRSSAI